MNEPDAMTHERAVELLPWLLNDSLPAGERAALEGHAKTCVSCRRELSELEQIRATLVASAPLETAPPVDMQRINRRIDAYGARRDRLGNVVAAIRQLFDSPLKIAVAVQSLVIAGLLGVLLLPPSATPNRPAPAYTTLTDGRALAPGEYLRIVVADGTSATDLESTIESIGLALIDGPSTRGVALLAFPDAADEEERAAAAARIADVPAVRFVAPVSSRP